MYKQKQRSHLSNRSAWRSAVALLAFLSLISIAPVALSENSDAEETDTLETLTVTARRVTENVQDSPLAVTVFSGHELDERNYIDISNLAQETPNLTLQKAGKTGAVSDAVYIRGLGQADSSPLSDPAVGVYVDGVYMARNVGNVVRLGDIQSIEVLRGPQGTLFGKNTIGGALNITLNKPSTGFDSSAELTIGSFSQYGAKAMLNAPISDNLFFRASVLGNTQDGYITLINYPGHELGDDHTALGRAQLLWQASSKLSFTLGFDAAATYTSGNPAYLTGVYPNALIPTIYNQQFSGNPASCATAAGQASNPVCFGAGTVPANPRVSREVFFGVNGERIGPRASDSQWGVNLLANWDIANEIALKSITSYRDQRDESQENLGYFEYLFFEGTKAPDTSRQFSQELQLTGKALDDKLSWVAGAYYSREDVGSVNLALTPLAVILPFNSYPVYSITHFNGRTTNYAGFGQATYSPLDWLHVTGGARWTEEKKDINALVTPSTLPLLYGHLKTTKVTPLGTVMADLSSNVHAYFSYSEGFRSGGFPARLAGNITALPTFGPENITTYEVGLKSEWFDRRLRANLAAFTGNYNDIQESGTNTTLNLPTVINAGSARIRGTEAELEAVATRGLTLSGSVAYLDDKLTSINPTANDGGVPITLADELPFAPRWKVSTAATYTYPLADGRELVARIDGDYTTRIIFSIGNQLHAQQGTVGLLNASLTYRLSGGHLEFVVGGRNLADRFYFTNGFQDQRINGVATNTIGQPRTAYATVRWHY